MTIVSSTAWSAWSHTIKIGEDFVRVSGDVASTFATVTVYHCGTDQREDPGGSMLARVPINELRGFLRAVSGSLGPEPDYTR